MRNADLCLASNAAGFSPREGPNAHESKFRPSLTAVNLSRGDRGEYGYAHYRNCIGNNSAHTANIRAWHTRSSFSSLNSSLRFLAEEGEQQQNLEYKHYVGKKKKSTKRLLGSPVHIFQTEKKYLKNNETQTKIKVIQ